MGRRRENAVMKIILENINPFFFFSFFEVRGQSVAFSQEQLSSLLGLRI